MNSVCQANCKCCIRSAAQLEIWKAEMLDEINMYRTLLKMPPQAMLSLSYPLLVDDTGAPQTTFHVTKSSLQHLPPEILNRIIGFTHGSSIMRLCHCFPQYLHLSKAIYDVAMCFPGYYLDPCQLWPTLEFPVGPMSKIGRLPTIELEGQNENDNNSDISDNEDSGHAFNGQFGMYGEDEEEDDDAPTTIPLCCMVPFFLLIRQLDYYGGSAYIFPYEPQYLDQIAPLLPKNVMIGDVPYNYPPDFEFECVSKFLYRWIKLGIKCRIRYLTIPLYFDAFGDSMGPRKMAAAEMLAELPYVDSLIIKPDVLPKSIALILPRIQGLSRLVLSSFSGFYVTIIQSCPSLRILEFSNFEELDLPLLFSIISVIESPKNLIRELKVVSANLSESDLLSLKKAGWSLRLVGWNEFDAKDGAPGFTWKRY
ncbi:hypothetical protein HDU79_006613 [Rhizoclosmatium sp. JEL0117]|nr:hypothetical protein HDU79_006613 [Rhizoclosmatium sp. JEL0117]